MSYLLQCNIEILSGQRVVMLLAWKTGGRQVERLWNGCACVFICAKYFGDLLFWRSVMWLDLASVRSRHCAAVNRGSPSQLEQSRLPHTLH